MNWNTSASFGRFVLILLVIGCDGQIDGVTHCGPVHDVNAWAATGITAHVDLPDQCPVDVGGGVHNVDFAADFSAPSQNVAGSTWGTVYFSDAQHLATAIALTEYWSGSPTSQTSVNTSYLAGYAERQAYEIDNKDYAQAEFPRSVGGNAVGKVELPYSYDLLAIIGGPISVAPQYQFTLTSTVSNAASPMTYAWRRDGTLVGTGSSVTDMRASTGSYAYLLTVTDADGDVGTESHVVYVGSGGGGGGGGGDNCNPNLSRAATDSVSNQKGVDSTAERDGRPAFQQQLPPCP